MLIHIIVMKQIGMQIQYKKVILKNRILNISERYDN
jgi:hypothetical protein